MKKLLFPICLLLFSNSYSQTYKTTARITLTMMKDTSNLISDKFDFAEILLSDTFSNSVTAKDSIKIVDRTDNLAIKPSSTGYLLVRECRKYPLKASTLTNYNFDTVRLKIWNISLDDYWIKVSASNFIKGKMYAYWYDSHAAPAYSLTTISSDVQSKRWVHIFPGADTKQYMILTQKLTP